VTLIHVHALPGAWQATSVIRNRRPTCSQPPLSTAPPAKQSRLLRPAGSTTTISWSLCFRDLRTRRTPLSAAPGNCPTSSQATRQQALDCGQTCCQDHGQLSTPTTGLEHRPSGRPPLDRPGQSAHAYEVEGRPTCGAAGDPWRLSSSARPARAGVDPLGAAPACLAIARDGTVGDEVRRSAAEQLAALDPSA